jgi:hypothetical protein
MFGKSLYRKPSPALLVAVTALFVALGGTATAAKVLITTADIKNGTIRVADINKQARKQLAKHAVTAGTADLAQVAQFSELTHSIDDAGSVNQLEASSVPTAGALLALGGDARVPRAAMPNIAARVYSSHDQAVPIQIAGGPVQRITFDKVSFDTAGMFKPSDPKRLVAPADGVYLISANVSWEISGVDGFNRAVTLWVNDHVISVDQRPPAEETRQVVTTAYKLKAGDFVEVGVGHDEQPSLSIDAVGDYAPSLSLVWIAPG